MKVLAVDPGNVDSAYVVFDIKLNRILEKGKVKNEKMLVLIRSWKGDPNLYLAVEMIKSYGMSVGDTIFETCVWIGRFIEAWGRPYELLARTKIKTHICNSARAKDKNVRLALIQRFDPTGNGKCPQIGTKPRPGPLYGVTSDVWSALAVAIVWADQRKQTVSALFN